MVLFVRLFLVGLCFSFNRAQLKEKEVVLTVACPRRLWEMREWEVTE